MSTQPTFTREQLEALDKAQLIEIILQMQAVVVHLQATVQQLEARVQELEDQIAKDSGNSSKPPSSDGLRKKPKSQRPKGKRKRGGQPGHKGHTLVMVEEPDQVVVHGVDVCTQCQHDLTAVSACMVEKRQVYDIPPVQLEVTEHQAAVKCCPHCGHHTTGAFPEGVVAPVQYGPRLKAQAVYLNTYQLLPLARTCDLLEDFYGHRPSEALVVAATTTTANQIAPSLQAIRAQLVEAAVVHGDETGLRVEGKGHWLHVLSSSHLTYYALHPKRGQQAMRAIGLIPQLRGWLVHDGWASYFTFDTCRHALCNAHHLRDLQFVVDQYQQPWAQAMMDLLRAMKQAVAGDPLSAAQRDAWLARYYDLLSQGFAANPPPPAEARPRGRPKQSPAKNLLDRLYRYQEQVLAFLRDRRVPFDNNLAERDVRMMKVKQKISGTFRTWHGATQFCDIRSYISTVRKQGQRVIDAILDALCGRPFIPIPE